MTTRELQMISKVVADAIRNVLSEVVPPVVQRIKALEESRTMVFEGAYDVGKTYRAGSVVQRSNGLFVAMRSTDEMPGESAHWRRIGSATA